jgi:hypothetical protein
MHLHELQHSAHIPPGRDGLFGLVRSLPENMRYENGPIVAEGDYVFVQGRFSNIGGPSALITVDIGNPSIICRNRFSA